MKDITISSVEEFHKLIRNHWDSSYVYRGEDSASYQLRPKFGRDIIHGRDVIKSTRDIKSVEQSYFIEFKRTAIPFLEFEPENDWDWLAIAQHHGLHTRLLDWSKNPLIAAYFAVYSAWKKHEKGDSVIYIFNFYELNQVDISKNPFGINSNEIYCPKHISRRISAQDGLFTIHQDPEEIFDTSTLERVLIKAQCHIELLATLSSYNINEFSVFPDLNGLSEHLTVAWI